MTAIKFQAPFSRTLEFRNRKLLQLALASALATGALVATSAADARVVSVQLSAPTIAFGGYEWPGVGKYEKITGVAYAEVDPNDPRNAVIVDLALSQPQAGPGQPGKTASGKIAYLFNFYILKPVNLAAVNPSLNGYGKVMYEPPNRGGKTWTALGRVSGGGNDPATIVDPTVLANSFLMPRGYTLVWSGWEPLVPLANLGTNLLASAALPIAVNANGSTITGPAYEYSAGTINLNYTPATLDKTLAKLTHRVHLNDVPVTVDPTLWNYNATATQLTLSGGFVPNDIYEFSYIAKDPEVAGLGFAAVRDMNSWIKYGTAADGNPLANYVTRIYTEISSQPGRLLNDFRHLGFNEDESGRKVLDGLMQWIAAGSGIGMNYRFSQSGRTERNRQDHLYPENLFPFANVATTDPHTGKTDSRYAKCQATATNTCPLGVEIYSANEYWVKTASLLHTTPDGSMDLPDSPYARNYFMSSMQHGTGNPANRGNCQQFQNPLSSSVTQRALFLALDKWTYGVAPPTSRVPKLSDGTMTQPANAGFPTNIPDPFAETPSGKVTYTGLKTTRYRYNMGPNFYETGIPTINPPVFTGPYQVDTAVPMTSVDGHPIYPSFAPKTDSDGNDIAGVRLPDVTVPLATYTGWALRRGVHANDGCEAAGQFIPFPATQAARIATGDPRPAVAERYPTFDAYDSQIRGAMNTMIQERLLLCEDSASELQRLRTAGALRGVPNPPASFVPYSFALANSSVVASPGALWPPNGKMVPVTLGVNAPDTCNVSCNITQISGTDGATAADWQITGPMTASLRSDRTGKNPNGRTYTLQLQCTDPANNLTATKTVAVNVPHDQGKK
ncbi:MAG TPA: alpha/beta hydrolase domain-containing protein [Casimicrobiaceae bacterium]|nr:alpha/beta hydrolase domain-containing protein [Casimicrobiaceae bacterium]